MHTRVLGNNGLEVSAVGFGAMGFSHGYGPAPDADEAIELMRQAFNLGCTFFDTAEGYGGGGSELTLGISPLRPAAGACWSPAGDITNMGNLTNRTADT